MNIHLIRTASLAAVMTLGMAAPGFAGHVSDAPSANPSESRPDVTAYEELNRTCGGVVMANDCMVGDYDMMETGSVVMADEPGYVAPVGTAPAYGYRGAIVESDPLADATSNPAEVGDTDTTIQQIRN